jgi:hypothetical protein
MSQLILPYSNQLRIPAAHPDGTPYSYGIELEGIVDRQNLMGRFDRVRQELTFPLGNQEPPRISFAWAAPRLAEKLRTLTWKNWVVKEHPDAHNDSSLSPKAARDNIWMLVEDEDIEIPLADLKNKYGIEINTPALWENEGIEYISRAFGALSKIGFESNESCGLHFHFSHGWKPREAYVPLTDNDLVRIKNIYRALRKNHPFFRSLIADERRGNPNANCRFVGNDALDMVSDRQALISLVNPPDLSPGGEADFNRNVAHNFSALDKHGTIENRMKEAAGYQSALGYIQFLAIFGYEAAENPDLKAEDIVERYFTRPVPHIRTSRPAAIC